jgi:hypothetical protein
MPPGVVKSEAVLPGVGLLLPESSLPIPSTLICLEVLL